MAVENDAPRLQRVLGHFPAYPASGAFAEDLLQNMTCTVRAARAFECFPDWKMSPRRLPNEMFFFVTDGKGRARVDGRPLALEAGRCLHVRRGSWHEAIHERKTPLRVLVIHYTALLDFSLTLTEVLNFPDVLDFRKDDLARDLLWEICRQSALQPPGWQQGANATALALLFHVIQQHAGSLSAAHPQRLSDLARIRPVIRLMRESLGTPLAMEEYAARAALSTAQFRRVFQRAVGLPPNQYLRKLRMEQAAFLLRSTPGTIEMISYQVGYTEPAFFAKSFKQEMGIAPGAYRRTRDVIEP